MRYLEKKDGQDGEVGEEEGSFNTSLNYSLTTQLHINLTPPRTIPHTLSHTLRLPCKALYRSVLSYSSYHEVTMDKALYRSVLGYSSYHMDKAMDKALYGPVRPCTLHLYLSPIPLRFYVPRSGTN